MKDQYFFGRTLATEIDLFAFPRTGSHFFRYCTQGLFDLVPFRTPGTGDPDAISRQNELDPDILYALSLREDGIPYQPVIFHTRAFGQHAAPVKREHKVIILIRDPVATIYSFYLVARDRWNMLENINHAQWVRAKLAGWHAFYTAAHDLIEAHPSESLLLRFESLARDPGELERLVEFIGVKPKLAPGFIHRLTRFDTITRPGDRTFYRGGDNSAWRNDPEFIALLERSDMPDPQRFGYTRPPEASPSRIG